MFATVKELFLVANSFKVLAHYALEKQYASIEFDRCFQLHNRTKALITSLMIAYLNVTEYL